MKGDFFRRGDQKVQNQMITTHRINFCRYTTRFCWISTLKNNEYHTYFQFQPLLPLLKKKKKIKVTEYFCLFYSMLYDKHIQVNLFLCPCLTWQPLTVSLTYSTSRLGCIDHDTLFVSPPSHSVMRSSCFDFKKYNGI